MLPSLQTATKVLTTKGDLELSTLRVQDVVEVSDNHRKLATEYYLGEELVRRDVWISLLRPLGSQATEGKVS